MNETPTRGPITSNSAHQARDAISSRHSLPRRTTKDLTAEGAESAVRPGSPQACPERSRRAFSAVGLSSGERKEDLFQVVGGRGPAARRGERGQLRQRTLAADAAAAQEDEPVAHARGV